MARRGFNVAFGKSIIGKSIISVFLIEVSGFNSFNFFFFFFFFFFIIYIFFYILNLTRKELENWNKKNEMNMDK